MASADLRNCLLDFERLYRSRIAALEQENEKFSETAASAMARASRFKNKYDFLAASSKTMSEVNRIELANLAAEVKHLATSNKDPEAVEGSQEERLLRLREEQLKRLASELEMINGCVESFKQRIEDLERAESLLTRQNLELMRELKEERKERTHLRRALSSEKKFKMPAISLPLNGFINRGDKQSLVELLQSLHRDLMSSTFKDESVGENGGTA